jgi:hypothetical protein
VTRALACHVAPGNASELVVHERQQLLHRLFASTPPFEEERRQVVGSHGRHGSWSRPRIRGIPLGFARPFYA